jgi:hypothetical protein
MARRAAFILFSLVITVIALPVGIGLALEGDSAPARAVCVAPLPPPVPPPSDFVPQIDNTYFPLEPGTTFLYLGRDEGEPARDEVVVTHMTKTILGVRTTVIFDRVWVGGEPSETTFDWYAQDRRGNVWYFGEDVFEYVNGHWIKSDESWEAGVDGAKPGIFMEAHPKVGDTYRQEFYVGHAEDIAHVTSLHANVTVPYGTFHHALETTECTRLEPGVIDLKDYARGVGEIVETTVRGGSSILKLVSVTHD